MVRSTLLLAVSALALSSCQTDQPRPFSRGGNSLDNPPRYGDNSRFVEPIAPAPTPLNPEVPAVPSTTIPPTVPGVDPGLSITPPTTTPATPGVTTPNTPTVSPPTVTAPTTPITPAAPAASDVPFARSAPGKPGFVYSPKDPTRIINVDGLRPGSKAKDPETGEIFRVPFQ